MAKAIGDTKDSAEADSKIEEAREAKRRRSANRSFPSEAFEQSMLLAKAIEAHAGGKPVNRLTLLGKLDKKPGSSATRELIANSTRYGLTEGSYVSENLSLTEDGRVVTNATTSPRIKMRTEFDLAIRRVAIFGSIYDEYAGKKFPSSEFLHDTIRLLGLAESYLNECADTFTVNCNYLGLIKTISGSQFLVTLEAALAELSDDSFSRTNTATASKASNNLLASEESFQTSSVGTVPGGIDWTKICFYITPIGPEGSEIRKHSDLFLNNLVEPALAELGLTVVRADRIGESGIIANQVLEYVLNARLAIVDLSWHNPNAFYEMAIRHVCRLPTVHISRKLDAIPFDLNQVRTIVIDTADIYTLVPQLQTHRSEIASQARAALSGAHSNQNPISVYMPGLNVTMPKKNG